MSFGHWLAKVGVHGGVMDLNAKAPEQLDSLTAGMRELASQQTPPSKEMWDEHFVTWLIERADFIDRYITPKIRKLYAGEKLPLHPYLTAPRVNITESIETTPFMKNGSTEPMVATE